MSYPVGVSVGLNVVRGQGDAVRQTAVLDVVLLCYQIAHTRLRDMDSPTKNPIDMDMTSLLNNHGVFQKSYCIEGGYI